MSFNYLLNRLLVATVNLIAAITVIFAMVRLVPGDPVRALLGDYMNPEAAEALRAQLGLNLPIWQQYLGFIGRLVHGDMGTSLMTKQPVFDEVVSNFGFTIQLALASLAIALLIGLPAGIVAALHRGKAADVIAMTVATFGFSIPNFWLGILLMIAFAVQLKWLPLFGVGNPSEPLDLARYLVMPAICLGFRGAALIARVTRSSMLDVMGLDYIRTARAKGLSERSVTWTHGFRNTLLPIITVTGTDLARMLGGTTVVEAVFSRPGLGTLLIGAVLNRDYPLIQGAFMIYLVVIVFTNLLVDLLYSRFDPRVVYK